MRHVAKRAPLCACLFAVGWGVAHAADRWPAYPMPTSDAALDAALVRIKLRPTYVACLKNGRDADDAVACIRAEYPYQHRRVDQAYRRLATRMGQFRRAPLDDEQERWLRWRDARCGREEIDIGMAACVVEMDADRATQLEERMTALAR